MGRPEPAAESLGCPEPAAEASGLDRGGAGVGEAGAAGSADVVGVGVVEVRGAVAARALWTDMGVNATSYNIGRLFKTLRKY